jgi:hypothetical protein
MKGRSASRGTCASPKAFVQFEVALDGRRVDVDQGAGVVALKRVTLGRQAERVGALDQGLLAIAATNRDINIASRESEQCAVTVASIACCVFSLKYLFCGLMYFCSAPVIGSRPKIFHGTQYCPPVAHETTPVTGSLTAVRAFCMAIVLLKSFSVIWLLVSP